MNDETSDNIRHFIGWFRDYLDSAKACYEASQLNGHSQRFSYLGAQYGVLESLAAVLCSGSIPGSRFRKLLSDFGSWRYGSFVSLPLIARFCDKRQSEKAAQIQEHARSIVSKWQKYETRHIPESDIATVELMHTCKIEDAREYCSNSIRLDHFQHNSVLWQHRNSVIHNLRDLGGSILPYNQEPYYCWTTDSKSGQAYWEITYPVEFLFKLSNTVLTNIEAYLIENETDPFTLYSFPDWFTKNE